MNNLNKQKTMPELPLCCEENAVVENDIEWAAKQDAIEKIKVMETSVGFYAMVRIKWRKDKELYLVTRRDRNTPKIFKDLKRLNDGLLALCPAKNFELFRNQGLPPRPETAKLPLSSKALYVKMPRKSRKTPE